MLRLPDVLPPTPHRLRAELLLDRHLSLDPDIISSAIAKRGLEPNAERKWQQSGDTFRRIVKGGEVNIVQRSTPRALDSFAAQIEHGTTGWDASAVRRHTHVIEISRVVTFLSSRS